MSKKVMSKAIGKDRIGKNAALILLDMKPPRLAAEYATSCPLKVCSIHLRCLNINDAAESVNRVL